MSLLHHLFLPHESNNQRAKALHPSFLASFLVFYLVFQVFISRASQALPQILGYASQIPPETVLVLTNKERQNRSLPSLSLDPALTRAAQAKAADMLTRDYWAHVSPTGVQPWFFITDSGYSYRYAGENLARDFSDSQSVVNAWMASPSHRDNLLSPRYQNIGIAVVDGRLSGRDTTLVVQMLGTKLGTPSRTGAVSSLSVKASETSALPPLPPVVSSPTPWVDHFRLTKTLSLVLLSIFSIILVFDIALVNHLRITRWTSKSLAHFIFLATILAAATAVLRGRIL